MTGLSFVTPLATWVRLRELDNTRLVLLSSGRWDGDLGVGSVCNPGETTWQHKWGSEEAGKAPTKVGWANDPDRGAYVEGAGDVHLYPHLPESANAKHLLRTMVLAPSRSSSPSTALAACSMLLRRWPRRRVTWARTIRGVRQRANPLTSHTSGLWLRSSWGTGNGSGWTGCTASPRTRSSTASSTSPCTGLRRLTDPRSPAI